MHKTNRYIRQELLQEIGPKGQQKLLDAHVVIVGCGGLGSIAAPYLAGAGIGKITLIDGDSTDITNLHRQIVFRDKEVGKNKAQALASYLKKLNGDIEVIYHPRMISKNNIYKIISNATVVLECTDNILTKYLVNDFCYIHNIPLAYGAIYKYDGYVSFFRNKDENSIHLRDVFPTPDEKIPSCSEVGVLNSIAGLIGLLQANEALKYILEIGEVLESILLTYDILNNSQFKMKLKKSFKKDMNKVYQDSIYRTNTSCLVYEKTFVEISENRNQFRLISILEPHENIFLDKKSEHTPLSTFDISTFIETHEINSKPIVFYCQSGRRSGKLVAELLAKKPALQIFSLQGGILNINDT